MAKFKVGDRVRIKKGKNWNYNWHMDWLIWVEATISELWNVSKLYWQEYSLKDFSKEWDTYCHYFEDMFDLVEERDRSKTYIKIATQEEKDFALEFYRKKGFEIDDITPISEWDIYIRAYFDWKSVSNFNSPWDIDITEEVLSQMPKKEEYITWPILPKFHCEQPRAIEFSITQPSILPHKPNKPMTTLAQELFDRFLKSDKTKVIEAVEQAEVIKEEMAELEKPVYDLLERLNYMKTELERAYERQDKAAIKEHLKNLQEINAIFGDKLFEQYKTIMKAINKMLAKK